MLSIIKSISSGFSEQLVFEFKPMLSGKNLTCTLHTPESLPLHCDPDKIQRVFDNLLRNAVLYSYKNSKIDITARVQEEQVIVTFQNQGDAIPPEKLARIFEQFYRLDTARSSSGGAGLGLAIAKQIRSFTAAPSTPSTGGQHNLYRDPSPFIRKTQEFSQRKEEKL